MGEFDLPSAVTRQLSILYYYCYDNYCLLVWYNTSTAAAATTTEGADVAHDHCYHYFTIPATAPVTNHDSVIRPDKNKKCIHSSLLYAIFACIHV